MNQFNSSKLLSMASKDEPTYSGEHQNSSETHIYRVIRSIPPVADYAKDLQHHYFHDAVSPFAPSPWNQHSTNLSMQKVTNSYSGKTMYRSRRNVFQNNGYPLPEHYRKVDDDEFVIRNKREYVEHILDHVKHTLDHTLDIIDLVEQVIHSIHSFLKHQNLRTGIIKYSTEFDVPLNAVKRASPNQMHIHVNGARPRVAVITGFFKGSYTRKFAVTVAHLVNKIGEGLYAGEELLGYCCFKSKKMQIAHQIYTSDLALIAIDPKSRHARDKYTVIEIQGQRYWPKLCSAAQIHDIKLGSEVWIVDQFESLKTGKVFKHWYSNEDAGVEGLYNVIQIKTTDGKAPTIEGDSGCCVCLPPEPNSDVIDVVGMVIGISEELPDKTTCTNAVLLPIVLEHMLRNLPPHLKKVGHLCEDGGLPANVDYSEELDFYIGEKSENLTVQSEKSIDSIVDSHNSGVSLSGLLQR